MTQNYVNGFFTKCAELKVPYEVAVNLYKAAATGGWPGSTRPPEDMNRPSGASFGTPTPPPQATPGMRTMPNRNPGAPTNAQTMPIRGGARPAATGIKSSIGPGAFQINLAKRFPGMSATGTNATAGATSK